MQFKTTLYAVGLITFSTLIGACGKDGETPKPAAPVVTETTKLALYNGIDAGSTFTLNKTAVGTTVGAAQTTGYQSVSYDPAATNTIVLKSSAGADVITKAVTLKKDVSFSFFTWREPIALGTPQTYGSKLVEDNLTAPSAGKAKIRLALMTRDAAAAYNIGLAQGGARLGVNLFTNVKLGDVTDYTEIAPGTYSFNFDRAGGATTDGSVSGTLEAGKVYTISTAGNFIGGVFSSNLVTNN